MVHENAIKLILEQHEIKKKWQVPMYVIEEIYKTKMA